MRKVDVHCSLLFDLYFIRNFHVVLNPLARLTVNVDLVCVHFIVWVLWTQCEAIEFKTNQYASLK